VSEAELNARVEGRVGRLTLNRPKALHALTGDMCDAMIAALMSWREDDSIAAVMLDHEGERGFCSGGDVRAAARSGRGDGREARAFFRKEYQLNALLFGYPKPVIAFMDGVTMGGGVGIARPARYRIATERTVLAMPEAAIGLFPDVGAGWYLSRLPGAVGLWMAMTGARLGSADCLLLGLAP
jgi:enoyl-CoA hydratase